MPTAILPPPLLLALMLLLRALRAPVLMLPPALEVRLMAPLKLLLVPLKVPAVVMLLPAASIPPSALLSVTLPKAEPPVASIWVLMAPVLRVPGA